MVFVPVSVILVFLLAKSLSMFELYLFQLCVLFCFSLCSFMVLFCFSDCVLF